MGNSLSLSLQKQIEKAVKILKKGGLVAFPTDTVYGLGAAVNISEAVERVFEVKKRPKDTALPVLIAEKDQIAEVAKEVPELAWLLADRFLPGALTIVLNKSKAIPDVVTGGGKTVALRIPAHPVPLKLIRDLGNPIVGTSANLSGKPSRLTAEEVYAQLGDKVDMIIDGGQCPGGKESTVIDLTTKTPTVLREGAIAKEALEMVYKAKAPVKGG
jgi:L-threonylcarbamoyladenylate synthase